MTLPMPESERLSNLYEYLFENVVESATALIQGDRSFSYGELIELIENVAATLRAMGVEPNNRVALLAENSPFWIACYLGCIKIGAIVAPLPMRLNVTQLTETLTDLGCTVLCVDASRLAKHLNDLPPDMPILTDKRANIDDPRVLEPQLHTSCATVMVDERTTLAALMFTSGSTGQPNAVKVSHRNIAANTESIITYLDLTVTDRILTILPFEYCFGTSCLHTHLRAGGSLVLQNSFLFLEDVLKRLDRTASTGFAGVPSTFQHLLRRSSLASRQYPSLRKVQQAGGRLPVAFIKEFNQVQPQAQLFIMYGQTEATARLSYLPPDRIADKLGSIGRGIPGTILRVLNEAGSPVAPGEIGEVDLRQAEVRRGARYSIDAAGRRRAAELRADVVHIGKRIEPQRAVTRKIELRGMNESFRPILR